MTKKEIDKWWDDIQSISDADLQIGYRVKVRKPTETNGAKKPAKRKRATATRPTRVARK